MLKKREKKEEKNGVVLDHELKQRREEMEKEGDESVNKQFLSIYYNRNAIFELFFFSFLLEV